MTAVLITAIICATIIILILSAGAAPIHELIEKVRASRDTLLLPGEIFEPEKGARDE